MPSLSTRGIALVFADLPYGITANSWDQVLDPTLFWSAVNSACAGTTVLSASYRFGALMIAANPKHFRYDLVWHKLKPPGPKGPGFRRPLYAALVVCAS